MRRSTVSLASIICLPFVIVGLVALHIWALHVPGSNNPAGIEVRNQEKETLPFHPYFTTKDTLAMVVFAMLFAYFVFYVPNYLGDAVNYVPANPLVTPPHIVPEWYFLPFYAILRAIPSKLGGVLLMFSVAGRALLRALARYIPRTVHDLPSNLSLVLPGIGDRCPCAGLPGRDPSGGQRAVSRPGSSRCTTLRTSLS